MQQLYLRRIVEDIIFGETNIMKIIKNPEMIKIKDLIILALNSVKCPTKLPCTSF